jgi:hypothetical protein
VPAPPIGWPEFHEYTDALGQLRYCECPPGSLTRWRPATPRGNLRPASSMILATSVFPSPYADPVPAPQTLPVSFYISANPSWRPSCKAWPAAGPDMTNGDAADTGSHANAIPAQDCDTNIMGGSGGGTAGSAPTFSPATRYGQPGRRSTIDAPANPSVVVNRRERMVAPPNLG